MDRQLINDLITLIDKSSITSFDYEENGVAVRIKKENNVVNTESKSSAPSKMIRGMLAYVSTLFKIVGF